MRLENLSINDLPLKELFHVLEDQVKSVQFWDSKHTVMTCMCIFLYLQCGNKQQLISVGNTKDETVIILRVRVQQMLC